MRPRLREALGLQQHRPQDPPALLFATQRDWVDPQNSIRFHQVALSQGVESRLVVFQGKRHGMAYWASAWPIVREWLAARMAAPQ